MELTEQEIKMLRKIHGKGYSLRSALFSKRFESNKFYKDILSKKERGILGSLEDKGLIKSVTDVHRIKDKRLAKKLGGWSFEMGYVIPTEKGIQEYKNSTDFLKKMWFGFQYF